MLVELRKREVEILKSEVVGKGAVGICLLIRKNFVNYLLNTGFKAAVFLRNKSHNKLCRNIAKNQRNEIVCFCKKQSAVNRAAVFIINNVVILIAKING